ncbi:coronafacic acid synthetase, acyl carrier protein [Myxococcus stipitatus DSM 14675]|uniref:Coronafacic acid synthetase, acyl carrier protein n=1 Tax=Myxococcus stipitatus (strain DSM 14675 / JCM 12634 / Mx s8) TaxID=1278073 RepID=L7U8D8_MYXSD|nr:acyl carrier protein [Myxococcus stipitatus]AGC43832.1 coronafacic acid synthetase, acyl carrier protein [Myxococcus stipitatus DSM 14675]
MHEELTESIKKILINNLFVELPPEQIGVDDGLQSVIGLDSVGFLELRVLCEDQFKVRISDEDFNTENFRTVSQLVSLISGLKTSAQGGAW